MLLVRKLDSQYQPCNKTIHEIFMEEMLLLFLKPENPRRNKTVTGILLEAVVDIVSEAVSAFIRQKKE